MPDVTYLSRFIAIFLTGALAACSTVPADLGRSDVDSMLAARGQIADQPEGEVAASRLINSLLEQPLTQEDTIRIALLNSPRLTAAYARLGFGAADVYEAGRVRNPVFSASLLFPSVSTEQSQLTLGLVTSFTDLITLSSRKRLSASAFAALKQSIGAEVQEVAAEAQRAYFTYVGAKQVRSLREQIARAGKLSADLAARYHEAGNMKARDLALERAAASEAQLAAIDASAHVALARTALANVLGISTGRDWSVPGQLDMPLSEEDELDSLLTLAKNSRLDLAAARTEVEMLADRLGVVNWTRWLGEMDVGMERERETDGSRITGPVIDWELPIFTQHKDVMLRADASLQIAIAEMQGLTIEIDNGVRLAYTTLENARDRIDEYRLVLIPQRVEAVSRTQEEVNFMLIGVFELLAAKQQEYHAYEGYLEAIRDYWLARVDLALATGTMLPSSAKSEQQRVKAGDLFKSKPATMDHMHHGSEKMNHSGHTMPSERAHEESEISPETPIDGKNGGQP